MTFNKNEFALLFAVCSCTQHSARRPFSNVYSRFLSLLSYFLYRVAKK